jgi:hypothetical protein
MSTINTPFNYNAGINYETWTMGRNPINIANDLTYVTQYFKLIKTFHCAAVGTSNPSTPIIDPTQQQVIQFLKKNKSVQLIMGTNSSALAQGGYGSPWSAGLMTSSTYTDAWVKMIIAAFGSANAVLTSLKCICLGNEVDANGPPSSDKNFKTYYTNWIPSAFTNLSASLKKYGLASIPVTSIIANYPLGAPSTNVVASKVTAYINTNWSAGWNAGNAFVFFNQYTPDWGKSSDFQKVIKYFNSVQGILKNSPQVFVGETGYSSENGIANEAKVINAVFAWMKQQQSTNAGLNLPLCFFQSFDHSQKPPGQQQMGLFSHVGGTYSIKKGIKIPSWSASPIG